MDYWKFRADFHLKNLYSVGYTFKYNRKRYTEKNISVLESKSLKICIFLSIKSEIEKKSVVEIKNLNIDQ